MGPGSCSGRPFDIFRRFGDEVMDQWLEERLWQEVLRSLRFWRLEHHSNSLLEAGTSVGKTEQDRPQLGWLVGRVVAFM